MSLRAQLNAAATLLDEGAASSAVRMLRGSWDPELPPGERVPLYCMWIRGLCDLGDLDHALVLAQRGAQEFERHADILIALGNVYDLRGQLDEARDAFERAIEVEPTGALQHYNLGAVVERLGDEAKAEAAYRRALAVDEEGPTLFEAHAALGALMRRMGRVDEAAEVYERYLEEDPLNVEILVEHGICLSDLDELDGAVDRFTTALSLDGNHSSGWYNLAITQYRLGDLPEAFRSMQRAYEADPNSPLTLAVFGAWYLGQLDSDIDKGLGLIYRAIDQLVELERHNLSLSYASLVCEEVFDALWSRGRPAEAREIARMAGQRDWITAHMLETLNEADHGRAPQVMAFTVTARAEAPSAPEHWPEDAQGYTTDFAVLAADEDEARRYSLEYLRSLEPQSQVQFKIEVVRPGPEDMSRLQITAQPRARGVVSVVSARAYFRGC